MELKPITVTFKEPQNGYWDGGKKSGGTFEPTIHCEDDPTRSYVKWGAWELNFYFNFPLHYENGINKGKSMTAAYVQKRALAYLKKVIKVPVTIK